MLTIRSNRRRTIGAFAAAVAGLALTMAHPLAIQVVRFTATAAGPAGELGPVEIVLNRFSTVVEKNKIMDAFSERGSAGLQEALQQAPSIGHLSAPGDQGFDLRYAAESRGENGDRHVVIASDQGMAFFEAADRPKSSEYPFTLVQLRIDKNGQGRGLASAYSNIAVDKPQGTLVLENLGDQPVMLNNLQLQKKGGK